MSLTGDWDDIKEKIGKNVEQQVLAPQREPPLQTKKDQYSAKPPGLKSDMFKGIPTSHWCPRPAKVTRME